MEKNKRTFPKTLPLIPLRDIVIFPHMIIPLFVGRDKSISAVEYSMDNNKLIFLSTQKNAKTNEPSIDEIHEIGTIAEILQVLKLSDGTVKLLTESICRGKISEIQDNDKFLEVCYDLNNENNSLNPKKEALIRSVKTLFKQYAKHNQRIPFESVSSITNINKPSKLTDSIAANLQIKTSEKQSLLEILDTQERLEKLCHMLESEIEIVKIERKVRGRVKKQMEMSQKEYYLTEQMKAIQKELGKHDEFKTELEELKERIRKAKMPKDVNTKAKKELKRLEMMPPMSAEATVVRNYIDWLTDIPWVKKDPDKLDLSKSEEILNQDHYGLENVKERILEFLAVRKLVDSMKGPILCLVGPPGVGKTSLGQSIARSMGRKFVRMSLGGVRDEAEIRGHRRTYIGALPGKIIQSMKKAGTKNPVIMLDEVDKMSMDFRGDPSSALLEVLDPEQNNSFNDHYLEIDYDLSEVMFLTTANVVYSIPLPLRDRMEIITIPGYTELEKAKIAEHFLIPKKIVEHGLNNDNIIFNSPIIKKIIRHFTREAGVRGLERYISTLCRKVAKQKVVEKKEVEIKITSKVLTDFLGPYKYRFGKAEKEHEVGIATGLAWTEVGGELLSTEVIILEGKGNLILTGKLGEVMRESAQAALSYVRSRRSFLGLEKNFYNKTDIHIHFPEGAIPKDGPSAGITMATALVSALTRKPVNKNVAMTGEITLRGKVLPIGGVKEKLLAAHRGGIKKILLPKENEKDMKEIPDKIKRALQLKFIEHMDEVLLEALVCPEDEVKTPLDQEKEKIEHLNKKFNKGSAISENISPH